MRTRVGGRVQTWVIPWVGDDAKVSDWDPADSAGFRLRRARLSLDGKVSCHVPFGLQVELADQASGRTGLLDAWTAWEIVPEAVVTVGVHKVPYSAGQEVSSKYLQLPDRPLTVLTMADFRELGVSVGGEVLDGLLSYGAGFYNGSGGLFTRGDDNPGLLTAARIEGGLGEIGETEADLTGGGLRFRLGAGAFYNDSATNLHHGLTGDLRLKVMGASLTVALLADRSEPIPRPETSTDENAVVDRYGYYVQAGYVIGTLPGLREREWLKGLEVVVRYEDLDDDAAITEGDVVLFSGGLSWVLPGRRVTVQAVYIRKHEKEGLAWDNDAVVLSSMVRF